MTDRKPVECWLTDMDGVLVHEGQAVPTQRAQETTDPANPSPSASRLSETARRRPGLHATTAVDRFPSRSPDPCVAVAQAPATEMWGRDARLWSASRILRARAQVAVPDRAVDRDRARRGVDVDHPRQPGQRELVAVRVREPVEGVARPDHAEGGRRPDRVLDGSTDAGSSRRRAWYSRLPAQFLTLETPCVRGRYG
jgi:hypothetical protein